jgi:hypothetical protein
LRGIEFSNIGFSGSRNPTQLSNDRAKHDTWQTDNLKKSDAVK